MTKNKKLKRKRIKRYKAQRAKIIDEIIAQRERNKLKMRNLLLGKSAKPEPTVSRWHTHSYMVNRSSGKTLYQQLYQQRLDQMIQQNKEIIQCLLKP